MMFKEKSVLDTFAERLRQDGDDRRSRVVTIQTAPGLVPAWALAKALETAPDDAEVYGAHMGDYGATVSIALCSREFPKRREGVQPPNVVFTIYTDRHPRGRSVDIEWPKRDD